MTFRAHGPLPAFVAAGLAAAVALTACNDVTYDASATTVPRLTTTTVFHPTGTPKELLASIADEVDGLSERLVANDGQRDVLTRIQAEWGVVRPQIVADRPELVAGFDSVLAQVQRSVDRRRPADADKAAKNLAVLIRSYES